MEGEERALPLWAKPISEADVAKIARLRIRYRLLRELIVELRETLSQRDPIGSAMAPTADVYLQALELETDDKTLDEMVLFVDEQLLNALSNLDDSHPVQRRIREDYRQGAETIFPVVVSKIVAGETFDELMSFMANERRILAEAVSDMPSQQFGLLRSGPEPRMARTLYAAGGRFDAYRKAMLSLVSADSRDFFVSASFEQTIGREGISELRGRTFWASVRGEDIPFSTLLVCDSPPTNAKMAWLISDAPDKPVIFPVATLIHTDTEYLPTVYSHCAELFEEVRQGRHSEDELVERIAILQWFLAHGMLYCRGSAAIAEWLCRALFKVKGYDIAWTAQPDLEALMRPEVRDFVSSYRSFTKMTGEGYEQKG